MNTTTNSNLIQDWYVFNDGRWASVLGTRSAGRSERQTDPGTLVAAA